MILLHGVLKEFLILLTLTVFSNTIFLHGNIAIIIARTSKGELGPIGHRHGPLPQLPINVKEVGNSVEFCENDS